MQSIIDLDHRLSAQCASLLAQPGADRWATVVRRVSQTGSYGVGWIVLMGVVVWWAADWKAALAGGLLVMGTQVVNTGVKMIFKRPRPVSELGHKPGSYSFPSAHTSMAVVGATVMTVLFPQLWWLWWLWTAVLAISRVLLGVHYVGDIMGGIVLGAIISALVAVPVMQSIT